jgi:hypothetical protein
MNQKQQGYNLIGSTDRLLKNNEIPIRYFNSGGGGGTIQETALKVKQSSLSSRNTLLNSKNTESFKNL